MINSAVITGRLTRDPELRYLQSGTGVCNITLAVDKGLSKDKQEEMKAQGKPTADFINVVVWGKLAETVANYTSKGQMIGVQGRIQSGQYQDKDGKTVYTTDINAYQVQFLEFKNKKESNNDYEDIEGFHPTDNEDIPF